MKITKLEQSGFIIESEAVLPKGLQPFRLVFDIGRMTPIEKLKDEKPADAFLVSHIHGDHFSPEHIQAMAPKALYLNSECKKNADDTGVHFTVPVELIKAGDVKQIGPFNVTFFAVDHGPNISAPVENLGFLIEENRKDANGTPICEKTYFSGDMFYAPGANSDEQNNVFKVDELEVDTALIPVGTFYTFGPQEALHFAKMFKKIGKIIPMHYEKMPETNGEFRKLCEGKFECV